MRCVGGRARTYGRHHSRCSASLAGHVQSFPLCVPQQHTRPSAHDLATTAVAVVRSARISCAKVWARAWRARRYLPPVQARSPACTARPPNRGRVLLACLVINTERKMSDPVGALTRRDALRGAETHPVTPDTLGTRVVAVLGQGKDLKRHTCSDDFGVHESHFARSALTLNS